MLFPTWEKAGLSKTAVSCLRLHQTVPGHISLDWSMCDIRFCISWPGKITRCISHISPDSVRLVDVRYSVLYFLARKITRCISHISPDAVRMVDVRYSVLYFLAGKNHRMYIAQPSATHPPPCIEHKLRDCRTPYLTMTNEHR